MKNNLYLVVSLFLIMSCSERVPSKSDQNGDRKYIQNKPVVKINSDFYKAVFVPNSDKLIGSSINDKGLKIYNPMRETVIELNDKNGAGITPMITKDGNNIVFQSYQFKDRKRYSSIYIQDILSKTLKPIVSDKRNLKLICLEDNNVIYVENNNIKSFDFIKNTYNDNPQNINVAFVDNNLNLCVYRNGKKTILNPSGKGNYIWVSKSSDDSLIVYNIVGKGSFVCDFEGNIISDLGRLHALKWTYDDRWIVGMDDYDDGYNYTKSDIIKVSKDGKKRINLTQNSNIIALYPSVDNKKHQLLFNNSEGRVYKMELKN